MYNNAEELCESIQKCFDYFVGQKKNFCFWVENTKIWFKVGAQEMKKDLGKREFAEIYCSTLRALFANESTKKTLEFREGTKNYAFFVENLLDNKTKETINKG